MNSKTSCIGGQCCLHPGIIIQLYITNTLQETSLDAVKVFQQSRPKQGAVLRMYKILGMVKAFCNRVRASCACRSFNPSPKVCIECIFDSMAELTDTSPPMGDPSSIALCELTTVKDGKADIMVIPHFHHH